jgi:hypothetical protein
VEPTELFRDSALVLDGITELVLALALVPLLLLLAKTDGLVEAPKEEEEFAVVVLLLRANDDRLLVVVHAADPSWGCTAKDDDDPECNRKSSPSGGALFRFCVATATMRLAWVEYLEDTRWLLLGR